MVMTNLDNNPRTFKIIRRTKDKSDLKSYKLAFVQYVYCPASELKYIVDDDRLIDKTQPYEYLYAVVASTLEFVPSELIFGISVPDYIKDYTEFMKGKDK